MARRLVTQREYATMRGFSPQYVSRLVSQGKIPREKDGRINVARADRAREAQSRAGRVVGKRQEHRATGRAKSKTVKAPRRSAATVERAPAGEPHTRFGALTAARTRREQALAEIAQLDWKQKQGELLPAAEVLEAQRRKNANFRTRIRRLARSVAAEVSRLTDPAEVEDALLRHIDQVLGELSVDPLGRMPDPLQTSSAEQSSVASRQSSVSMPPAPPAETGVISL